MHLRSLAINKQTGNRNPAGLNCLAEVLYCFWFLKLMDPRAESLRIAGDWPKFSPATQIARGTISIAFHSMIPNTSMNAMCNPWPIAILLAPDGASFKRYGVRSNSDLLVTRL